VARNEGAFGCGAEGSDDSGSDLSGDGHQIGAGHDCPRRAGPLRSEGEKYHEPLRFGDCCGACTKLFCVSGCDGLGQYVLVLGERHVVLQRASH